MTNWEIDLYAGLVNLVLTEGEFRKGRNGNTWSIFGHSFEIDMQYDGFPILQGRRIAFKGVFGELSAFLKGAKTLAEFEACGCPYWKLWADDKGNLELDYGTAWIDFNGVNQVKELVKTIKTNPTDRRMIITGWRPDRLAKLSLPCCHLLYQWYVRDGKYLDMIWYQRSVDTMIGLPSDMVFAGAFNALIAKETNLIPGRIKFVLGDTHIYEEHEEGAREYLERVQDRMFVPVNHSTYPEAKTTNFDYDMIALLNYNPEPPIKFELKA